MAVKTLTYVLLGKDSLSPVARKAGAETEAAFGDMGKASTSFGKAASVATLAVGAALAAIAVESIKSAANFQSSMEKIHTQAGATQASVNSLTKSVLALAPSREQGPEQLSEALYHLKSVGLDDADAMKALKVSSDLAAVGGANLEDTTNALAGAWRSGIKGAQSFGETASTVNAIIGAGNMRMEDFVAAIGTGILPAAKTFGVSLQSVGSALALMTDEGVPADSAATRLKMSLSLLAAPSGAASAQLAKIGVTGLQLANTMRGSSGLIGAIALLKSHLDASGMSASQQAILLSHAFGGGRSSSAILTLINNLAVLKKKQDQINDSTNQYGADVIAQRKTAAAQFDMLKSSVDTLGIQLGLALLPPVTNFAKTLSTTVLPDVRAVIGFLTSPDIKPWSEIAAKIVVAAVAATAIYTGLKKAAAITGLDKLVNAVKTQAPSPVAAASANMSTAADTMYQASLNMLKAAGMTEDAAVASKTGTEIGGAEAVAMEAAAPTLGTLIGAAVVAQVAGYLAYKKFSNDFTSGVKGASQAGLYGSSGEAATLPQVLAGTGTNTSVKVSVNSTALTALLNQLGYAPAAIKKINALSIKPKTTVGQLDALIYSLGGTQADILAINKLLVKPKTSTVDVDALGKKIGLTKSQIDTINSMHIKPGDNTVAIDDLLKSIGLTSKQIAAVNRLTIAPKANPNSIDAILARIGLTPGRIAAVNRLNLKPGENPIAIDDVLRRIGLTTGQIANVNKLILKPKADTSQIDRAAAAINNLPKNKVVQVTVDVIAVGNGVSLINNTGNVSIRRTAGGLTGYATGTKSAMPGWAWVGEKGPELMKMRGGEQIGPVLGGSGSSGGNTYNISVSPTATAHPADIGREVVNAIRQFEKGSGKGWRS